MLIKKTVVSGFKEIESFNLNLYFEIHNGQGWLMNFDFILEDNIQVSGQYNGEKIVHYNVSNGFVTPELMSTIQDKLYEVKDEFTPKNTEELEVTV